ncbi:MAG: DUF3237 domain-containing protein [Acidimicrobiia bacterium]|nr:DUF3237 domain-containing protein [Acidimicrobiia bacterium]
MAVELVPLCEVSVVLRDPIDVGIGPAGWRMIFEVEAARVRGERLNAELRGRAAADWLAVTGTTGALDVRATFETDDGAVVFAHYLGRTDLSRGPGASPIYVAPVFETGDPRYAWLNTLQAVGKGVLTGNHLEYEWFEVR